MRHQSDEGSSPVTAAFVRITEMYMCGGNCHWEWRHAIADAGDHENLLPTGTLELGCDAFLLRLAISHAATGKFEKAIEAADLCVKFCEPLEDVQFEVYQDFKPVPFPLAQLFRAALSLQLDSGDSVISHLASCFEQSEVIRNEAVALACLHLLRNSGHSEVGSTVFSNLGKHICALSPAERTQIESRCESILSELLDGSLVRSGLQTGQSESIAIEMSQFITRNTTIMSESSDQLVPAEILGRQVLGVCPDCGSEGRLWECYERMTTHWDKRCKLCNCVGFILNVPPHPLVESDQDEAPF